MRERAARAIQAVFAALGFPAITDEEVEAATYALDSRDLPDRDRAADVAAADRVLAEGISGLDVARELDRHGFTDVAEAILGMQRQRVSADYLQTSAIIDSTGRSARQSTIRTATRGRAPATAWTASAGSACSIFRTSSTRARLTARRTRNGRGRREACCHRRQRVGRRRDRPRARRSPTDCATTIGGLAHQDVLEALIQGVRDAGAAPRLVRVRRASDVAFIGHDGAALAGSGVAIGIQSKGTTVIHRADLQPLDNLELFGMAPSLTLDSYRADRPQCRRATR